MVDFTLSRTAEDHDNEQYALAYNTDDIGVLERDTPLGEAFLVWRALATDADKAPSASAFRSVLDRKPALAAQLHAAQCLVSGVGFRIDSPGQDSLRRIGISGELDLTAPQLNNRAFAGFLFFASSTTVASYQRVCEICNGVQREYARLALPVDDSSGPLAYFMTRHLDATEMPLDKVRDIAALSDTDA